MAVKIKKMLVCKKRKKGGEGNKPRLLRVKYDEEVI